MRRFADFCCIQRNCCLFDRLLFSLCSLLASFYPTYFPYWLSGGWLRVGECHVIYLHEAEKLFLLPHIQLYAVISPLNAFSPLLFPVFSHCSFWRVRWHFR